MIQSMTGFGRAAGTVLGREATVEIKTVNNRFRDVFARLPRQFSALEEPLKKLVGERISRGRVDLNVQVADGGEREKKVSLDLDLARAYHDILTKLKDEFSLSGEVTLQHLSGFRDIIVFEEEELDLEAFQAELGLVVNEALDRLIEMRTVEGQAIVDDFRSRLAAMSGWVDEIDSRRGTVLEEAKTRLEERIKSLAEGVELDQGRLAQETAYLADRSDITEEIVRLRSHFNQFADVLNNGGVAGRRLEFMLQEINREVNTIGSKSSETAITNRVVDLKTELEKLREQVQNVE